MGRRRSSAWRSIAEQLTGVSHEQARDILWNAFDARYRPEMRRMERSLLLNQLDRAVEEPPATRWTTCAPGIGLVGYAQIDPKTEYKRKA